MSDYRKIERTRRKYLLVEERKIFGSDIARTNKIYKECRIERLAAVVVGNNGESLTGSEGKGSRDRKFSDCTDSSIFSQFSASSVSWKNIISRTLFANNNPS